MQTQQDESYDTHSDTTWNTSDSDIEVSLVKVNLNIVDDLLHDSSSDKENTNHGNNVQCAEKPVFRLNIHAAVRSDSSDPGDEHMNLNKAQSDILPMCYYAPLTEIIEKSSDLNVSASTRQSDHTGDLLDLHLSTASASGICMEDVDNSWDLSPVRPPHKCPSRTFLYDKVLMCSLLSFAFSYN